MLLNFFVSCMCNEDAEGKLQHTLTVFVVMMKLCVHISVAYTKLLSFNDTVVYSLIVLICHVVYAAAGLFGRVFALQFSAPET